MTLAFYTFTQEGWNVEINPTETTQRMVHKANGELRVAISIELLRRAFQCPADVRPVACYIDGEHDIAYFTFIGDRLPAPVDGVAVQHKLACRSLHTGFGHVDVIEWPGYETQQWADLGVRLLTKSEALEAQQAADAERLSRSARRSQARRAAMDSLDLVRDPTDR